MSRWNKAGTGAAAAAVAGAGVLGWSLLEAQAHRLRRFTVPVLPAGSAAVKLLHLSDLHLLPSQHRRVEWVQSLAVERPDAVITTGDHLSHRNALPTVLTALLPFLHLPGAFVTGSNDFFAPVAKNPLGYLRGPSDVTQRSDAGSPMPGRELITALRAAGWVHLDNARGRLDLPGLRLDLVGTADAHIDADAYPDAHPRTDSSNGSAAIRIGVTHAPYARVLDRMRADDVALALAGHTHGGQVCLPGVGALVTNCDLDRRMAKGLHRWPQAAPAATGPGRTDSSRAQESASMWLHVSAGLGTSPLTPVRLACPPEASLLTLVPVTARAAA